MRVINRVFQQFNQASVIPKWPRHLGPLDPCPKIDQNKLTLFNMRYCPYAQRTVLLLDAKKIPYDNINVDTMYKPQWLLDRNPLGKVPTVQIGDDVIYESLPLNDFIEEIYPDPPLSPKSPYGKAYDRMLLSHFDNVILLFFKLLKSTRPDVNRPKLLQKFQSKMSIFEIELNKRGTKYFFAQEQPGVLDFNIWPWFERLDVFPIAYPDVGGTLLPEKSFPKLNAWVEVMNDEPVVKNSSLDTQMHLSFLLSLRDGNPIYDPENNRPWLSKMKNSEEIQAQYVGPLGPRTKSQL